jgi:hypothetical protein
MPGQPYQLVPHYNAARPLLRWVCGARQAATLLHGSWFLQTALVLFPDQALPL